MESEIKKPRLYNWHISNEELENGDADRKIPDSF